MAALTPEPLVVELEFDVVDELLELVESSSLLVVLVVVPELDLLAVVDCALCVTPAKTAAASATPPTAVAVPATASRRRSRSAVFVMAPTMAVGASAARH